MLNRQVRWMIRAATALLVLALSVYLSTPLLIGSVIRDRITAYGFTVDDLTISYPNWRRFTIRSVRFHGSAGGRPIDCKSGGIDVSYDVGELLAGKFRRVYVPRAMFALKPAPPGAAVRGRSTGQTPWTVAQVAAVLTGQWSTSLATRELQVDEITTEGLAPTGGVAIGDLSVRRNTHGVRVSALLRMPWLGSSGMLAIQGSASVDGLLSLSVHETAGNETIVARIKSAPGEAPEIFQGDFELDVASVTRLFKQLASDPHSPFEVRGSIRGDWVLSLPEDGQAAFSQSAKLESRQRLNVLLAHPNAFVDTARFTAGAGIRLDDGNLSWILQSGSLLTVELDAPADSSGRGGRVELRSDKLAGRYGVSGQLQELRIDSGASLRLLPFTLDDIHVEGSRLDLDTPGVLRYDKTTGRWDIDPLTVSFSDLSVKRGGQQLSVGPAHVDISPVEKTDGLKFTVAKIQVDTINGKIGDTNLPQSAVHADLQFTPQNITAKGAVMLAANKLVVNFKASHEIETASGSATFELKAAKFSPGKLSLSDIIQPWPTDADLAGGTMTASATASWTPTCQQCKTPEWQTRQTLFLTAKNLSGFYDSVTFTGFSADVSLENDAQHGPTGSARLGMARFNAGFPVTDIQSQLALNYDGNREMPVVTLKELTARTLGGEVSVVPTRWDPGQRESQIVVEVKSVSLGELVRLEQPRGLDVSGQLDGRLPFLLTEKGLQLKNGSLQARSPGGKIRYLPEDSTTGTVETDSSVDQLLQILRDFDYHFLAVTAEYPATGDLKMKLAIKGANRHWQQGQPVNLNVNIEDNIPTLLRSLQIADQITEELTDRVKRRYHPGR